VGLVLARIFKKVQENDLYIGASAPKIIAAGGTIFSEIKLSFSAIFLIKAAKNSEQIKLSF